MAGPTLSGNQTILTWTGGAGFNTGAISWGASVADLMLVVAISLTSTTNTPQSVTSITDSLGLVWTRASSLTQAGIDNGVTGAPRAETVEIWYAPSAGSPSWVGHTISVATSANVDVGIVYAVRLLGVVLAAPLDLNVSLPGSAKRTSTSTAATLTLAGLSTNTANVCVFAVRAAMGAGNNINTGTFQLDGASSTFGQSTLLNGANFNIMGTAGWQLSAAKSGGSIVSATSIQNSMILAVAFTSDAQVVTPVRSFGTVIS